MSMRKLLRWTKVEFRMDRNVAKVNDSHFRLHEEENTNIASNVSQNTYQRYERRLLMTITNISSHS